jgi:hypothetical protein
MRRFITTLASALLLAVPLMAEDRTPPPPTPMPLKQELPSGVVPPGVTSPAMPPGSVSGSRPEIMKEIREVEGQLRAVKEKADQDPEVSKLRQAVDEAQKVYRAKVEEVMAKDPSFAVLKARRDEIRAKLTTPRPEALPHKKDGADIPAMNPPVTAPVTH